MPVVVHEYKRQGLVFRTLAEKMEKDWYEWIIEIAGPASALDEIDEVEYILHPTFPNRIRRRRNPEKCFQLIESGWGEFDITVNVYFSDGEEKSMIVPLKFS